MTTTSAVKHLIVAALLSTTALACSSAGNDDTSDATTTTSVHDVATTSAPVTPAPSEAPPAPAWETVAAPSDCMCFDGSPYSVLVRRADPTKVLLYLEGGGACFSADMCGPDSTSFKRTVTTSEDLAKEGGIFQLGEPDNPFADFSMVYVPYCTGDVHSGNVTADYGNGVVIEHKGAVNANFGLDTLIAEFPDATQVVVAGSSAGGFRTPLLAGIAGDRLPHAAIAVLADGSGAIPDAMGLVAANWKVLDTLPAWPEFAGLTIDTFTPATAFVAAATHNPAIRFARYDNASDETLSGYATMAGLSPNDLVSVMKANERAIEGVGVTVSNWIAPGTEHTIATRTKLYTEEMNGIRFVDWLSAYLRGDSSPDNYCVDCAG